jgi:hypothetical protein
MSTIVITRESLRAAGACYDAGDDRAGRPRRIDALFPPEGLPVTAESVELARAAGVPDRDIFWALTYGCPEVTDTHWRLIACACARRALEAERAAGREPDQRSWRAVEVAERFARGEATDQELAAARNEAWAWAWAAPPSSASRAARRWAARAWDGSFLVWVTEEAMASADARRFAVDVFVEVINAEEAA